MAIDSTTKRAREHTILPVEPRGDTVIMRPGGDLAGYSRTEFSGELSRVKSLFQSAPGRRTFRNLIVDCSGSAYFGSEMIGHLVDIRKSIPEDGVMALSGLSPDMEAGLKVMKLDQMWMTFDDREAAARAIASEPFREKVGRNRRQLGILAALGVVLAIVLLFTLTPIGEWIFGYGPANDYDRVAGYVESWQNLRKGDPSPTELEVNGKRLRTRVAGFIEDRSEDSAEMSAGHLRVLRAAELLQTEMVRPRDSKHADLLLEMARARLAIEEERGLALTPLPGEPEIPDAMPMQYSTRETNASGEREVLGGTPQPRASSGRDGGYLPPEAYETTDSEGDDSDAKPSQEPRKSSPKKASVEAASTPAPKTPASKTPANESESVIDEVTDPAAAELPSGDPAAMTDAPKADDETPATTSPAATSPATSLDTTERSAEAARLRREVARLRAEAERLRQQAAKQAKSGGEPTGEAEPSSEAE